MIFNGERMINHPNSAIFISHLDRYKFARKFVRNKDVLDIACGTGYGAEYLAHYARMVLGVEVDRAVVNYCRKKYKIKNLCYELIFRQKITQRLINKFNVVISFETIEHTKRPKNFLDNLKLYLRAKKGTIILSTPNNFLKIHPSENKFHQYEFDMIELHKLLMEKFPNANIKVYGQGKTNIRRKESERQTGIKPKKKILEKFLKAIYNFDLSHWHLLRYFEQLEIYKKIGSLQRSYSHYNKIYKINISENFYNPEVAIFIVIF